MWRQNHPDFTPCQHCPSCVLLPAISKLLKVASHPYLLKEYRHNTDNDSHSKTYEFACTALTDTHLVELGGPVFSSSILSGSRIEMSGKMKALDRLLSHFSSHFDKVISLPFPSLPSPRAHRGGQTLVFSNSTKMLSLIEMYVQGKGWRYW
jgi:SNF2 family DNA or RNA helicase